MPVSATPPLAIPLAPNRSRISRTRARLINPPINPPVCTARRLPARDNDVFDAYDCSDWRLRAGMRGVCAFGHRRCEHQGEEVFRRVAQSTHAEATEGSVGGSLSKWCCQDVRFKADSGSGVKNYIGVAAVC